MSVILLRLSCVARSRLQQGTPRDPSVGLESVFYVIYYVTKIVHDDSASGDYILRVNICFGT